MVYIHTYIWLIFMVNVGKYTIHGYYVYSPEVVLNGRQEMGSLATTYAEFEFAPQNNCREFGTLEDTLTLRQRAEHYVILLMFQKSGEKTTVWIYKTLSITGSTTYQTVAGFLPSTVSLSNKI